MAVISRISAPGKAELMKLRNAAAASISACQFAIMVCCPSEREDRGKPQLLQFVVLCVLVRVRLTGRLYAK